MWLSIQEETKMRRIEEYFSLNQIAIVQSLVMFIIGAVVSALLGEALKSGLQAETIALLVVFVCLALMAYVLFALVRNTDVLRDRVGIKVTYLDESRFSRKYLYQQATDTVKKATKSISVVNSFIAESGTESDDAETKKMRETYYRALLECAKTGKVKYKRIVQLGDNDSVGNLMSDDTAYAKHFCEILDAKKQNPQLDVGLISVPARRPITFVLVDDDYLIWQINQVFQENNRTKMRMQGYFLFEDPRHQITESFRAFFESFGYGNQKEVSDKDLVKENCN
jgi:ABC-type multidrug transport system fused ATPase/permease subunit